MISTLDCDEIILCCSANLTLIDAIYIEFLRSGATSIIIALGSSGGVGGGV